MTQENGGRRLELVTPRGLRVVQANFKEPVEEPEAELVDPSIPDPFGDWCYVIWKTERCPCQDPKCQQIQMLGVAGDEEEAAEIIADYVETKNGELAEKMADATEDERVMWSRRLLRIREPGLQAVDIRGDKVVAERRPYGSWNENG